MTTVATPPLVEMRDINVAFGGVHATRDATIHLHAGEVVGLVGGNGAGKSTLMRVLSGAHPADSGEIRIDGHPVAITRNEAVTSPREVRMRQWRASPSQAASRTSWPARRCGSTPWTRAQRTR